MSRMFSGVRTWNPVVGCRHNCLYCYARRLAETRLKQLPQYNGFKPYLVEKELCKKFKGGTIFVSSMGDLFGDWVDAFCIDSVLRTIKESRHTIFYLLTKNPKRYNQFTDMMSQNVILGTTIESNAVPGAISKAPWPVIRYLDLAKTNYRRKFISVEPILDFNLEQLVGWIRKIGPEFVYVGYDNYPQRNKLPEPPLAKTLELIARLKEFTEVREKTIRKAWWEIG